MEDRLANATREDRVVLEQLLRKLFYPDVPDSDDRIVELLATFREEYRLFSGRLNDYDDRSLWSTKHNKNLMAGRSHFWHQLHSLDCTKYLGRFACRVLSKIVGIGSAERNWKTVKHLKTGKRSHLTPERVKKAATVYANATVQEARAIDPHDPQSNTAMWDDDDLDEKFDCFLEGNQTGAEQKRTFRCWYEEWEQSSRFANNPANEAKLLVKYGGIVFYDLDQKTDYKVLKEKLHWERPSTKKGVRHGGFCLICKPLKIEDADNDETDPAGKTEVLPIEEGADIYYLIKKTDPTLNGTVDIELDHYVAEQGRDTDYEDNNDETDSEDSADLNIEVQI